jgi:hypothetical protein
VIKKIFPKKKKKKHPITTHKIRRIMGLSMKLRILISPIWSWRRLKNPKQALESPIITKSRRRNRSTPQGALNKASLLRN